MELRDAFSVPAAPGRVFEALSDPDTLARVLPGCERVIQLGPAEADGTLHYEARLRLGQPAQAYVAGITFHPATTGNAASFDLTAHGQHGMARGTGTLGLIARDGATEVEYSLSLDEMTLPGEAQAALSNGQARVWTGAIARRLALPRPTLAPVSPTTVRTRYGDVVALPRQTSPSPWLPFVAVGVVLAALVLVVSVARRLMSSGETPSDA